MLTGIRGPRRLVAFVGALASAALLCALWAGVASAAAGTGTIEICKSAANGAAGTAFTFQLQRGTNAPLSPNTVRTHLENVYEKLGVSNRTAAAARMFGPPDHRA